MTVIRQMESIIHLLRKPSLPHTCPGGRCQGRSHRSCREHVGARRQRKRVFKSFFHLPRTQVWGQWSPTALAPVASVCTLWLIFLIYARSLMIIGTLTIVLRISHKVPVWVLFQNGLLQIIDTFRFSSRIPPNMFTVFALPRTRRPKPASSNNQKAGSFLF